MPHISITAGHYSPKFYWTVDRARHDSSEFFNLTSNRIEIALFASVDLVEDEWGVVSATDPGVRINGPWRVFEISSGDLGDGGANDSPHLRHVSAPLAAAGVSILYQSSYFTDFILVKEVDFQRASEIFKSCGWNVDPLARPVRRRSTHLAPDEVTEYLPMLSPVPPPPPIAEITLLSIPLACVGLSRDTEERNSERVKKYIVWPERALAALERERGEAAEGGSSGGTPLRRRRSMSPARPFMSYTRTEDGASVLTEVRVLRAMFSTREEKADLLSAGELDGISESELTGGEEDDLDVSDTESVGDNDNENSANESGSDTDADAPPPSPSPQTSPQRHGHSLPGTPTDFCNGNGSIPIHWAGACSSTSSSAATTPPTYSARSNFGLGVAVGVGMTHIYPAHLRTQSETERSVRILHGLRPRRASECTPRRYNFDDEDEVQPRVSRSMRCLQLDLRGIGGTDDTHMDKSGLVTRFSSVLNKGGVRMLYSSTTHTANLLVQGADVWKAEELLRVSEDDEDENDLDTPNPACLALDEDVAAPPAPA